MGRNGESKNGWEVLKGGLFPGSHKYLDFGCLGLFKVMLVCFQYIYTHIYIYIHICIYTQPKCKPQVQEQKTVVVFFWPSNSKTSATEFSQAPNLTLFLDAGYASSHRRSTGKRRLGYGASSESMVLSGLYRWNTVESLAITKKHTFCKSFSHYSQL